VPRVQIPYRLDPVAIGEGGYARVFRGVHRETGEEAAVKKPRRGDETGLARFKREVEIQSTLDHPNVMPLLEYSLEDRWLAMPLARRNLTEAVERDRAITPFQLLGVLRDAVRGLDYAHRRHYVHRDVNPNNLLEVDDPRRWVVADWGLVRKPPGDSSPRLTRREKPLGTVGFIAPEAIADPHEADARCDVYSVGRIAHFVVTEVWPRDPFPLPSPGWLWADFISACTAENRSARTTSMAGVLNLLNDVESRISELRGNRSPPSWHAGDYECPRCGFPIYGARCENCGRVWD
jgi:serine/threonine protein kinase